ncbi:hypothetical protein [Nonomuraea cavernae]|uniref:hypothetical protein n=1 Tax=Nonomuraea cavernae TaxID=2045107 RepID=UPI0033E15B9A
MAERSLTGDPQVLDRFVYFAEVHGHGVNLRLGLLDLAGKARSRASILFNSHAPGSGSCASGLASTGKQRRAYEQQDPPLRHGFTSCSAGRTKRLNENISVADVLGFQHCHRIP